MRARRREAEHLPINAMLVQHGLAISDVAMTAHSDVVVARVMQNRVAVAVDRHLNSARSGAERVEIRLRIKVIVEVDDLHRVPVPSAQCPVPSVWPNRGYSALGTGHWALLSLR